jgi:hypothetical protein
MSFNSLDASEKETVLQCMRLILDETRLIEDPEFQTRLGIDRDQLRSIITAWPELDDLITDAGSDAVLAINNCLNEACYGLNINERLERKYSVPHDEVRAVFNKIRTLWDKQGLLSRDGLT